MACSKPSNTAPPQASAHTGKEDLPALFRLLDASGDGELNFSAWAAPWHSMLHSVPGRARPRLCGARNPMALSYRGSAEFELHCYCLPQASCGWACGVRCRAQLTRLRSMLINTCSRF